MESVWSAYELSMVHQWNSYSIPTCRTHMKHFRNMSMPYGITMECLLNTNAIHMTMEYLWNANGISIGALTTY